MVNMANIKNKKSFSTPSAKPVDVEYRLKRLKDTLTEAAIDRKSTRLNSSHVSESRMPSSA